MKDQSQEESWRLAGISGTIGFATALIGLLDKLLSLGLVPKLEQLFELKPGWLWIRGSALYFGVVLLLIVCTWVWNPQFVLQARELFRNRRTLLCVKGMISSIIIIVFVVGVLLLFSRDVTLPGDAERLFPQAARMGPTIIRPYGRNGEVKYTFHEETPTYGPANGYAQITFRTFGGSVKESCGWVIFLMKGLNLAGYKEIRFLVRGELGTERVGVKAKDARGTEVDLKLEGQYLRQGKITTDWQEATVPFAEFGRVDFELMDNFSIFVDGEMAGTRPQTIYIGDFRLR